MLQSIRDKTSGWIAYLIIFLISIPFALWGLNSYLGGGEVMPVATVDGQDISAQSLDRAYADYRHRLSQTFDGTIPAIFDHESLMKDQVLSQMIEELSLQTYINEHKYRISNRQLNQIIRSMPVFQRNSQFDPELYQRQIASQGYSVAGFESDLRQAQKIAQLRAGIISTVFSTPDAREKLITLSNQTRSIRYITKTLNIEEYSVSDTNIKEHFEKNQTDYMTDEQVRIDYIELSLDDIKQDIDIDDEQVRRQYDATKTAYTSAETRTASHILLTLPPDASVETDQQVKNQLNDIHAQLTAGSDFAVLAKKYSQDSVSSKIGGDLGEIERGVMVKPFETALFDLAVGEISKPIRTSFGWHLIKLHDVSGGEVRSFTAVRDEIENEIRTTLAESQFYDLIENLANLVYEQPDALLPAAEQLGLTVQTSDWFGRYSNKGIAVEEKIRDIAFSPEVLIQGRNSEAIQLADDANGSRIAFIRLNTHRSATVKNFEAVRDEIINTIKQNKARQDNQIVGKKALETLRSKQQSLDIVANNWHTDIMYAPDLRRQSESLNPEIVKLAFTLPKPDLGSIFQGFTHVNGDYSIIELLAVETTEIALTDEQSAAFDVAIADQEYQSVRKLVRSRADVTRVAIDELN